MVKTMPKRTRKYPSAKKTTTKEGRKEYMKLQMRERRKKQRQALKAVRSELEKQIPDIPKLRKLLGVGLGKPKKKKRG